MATANDILKVLKNEVGNTESPAGSNNVKYNTWYYGREVSGSNYAWCLVFMAWSFSKAGASSLFYGGKKTASCTTLANYAKANGQWVTSGYKTGDLVFMNFSGGTATQHVGFVESVSNGEVHTIEGNTSFVEAGSQSNGGAVARKTRKLSVIVGAYRPKYGGTTVATVTTKAITIPAKQIKSGAKGDAVKALQILLNGYGYSCGTADGDFGAKTDTALKKYQKASGLTADGIAGANTWKALIGG